MAYYPLTLSLSGIISVNFKENYTGSIMISGSILLAGRTGFITKGFSLGWLWAGLKSF
jgi:hypothetical protein